MSQQKKITFRQRVFKAGIWSAAGFSISQIIRFGSNLLMTRLLAPEMFGVMAIAYMILYGLALFSDIGLRQSIVQSKRGNDTAFLNTAWSIQILRGILIWLFACIISLIIIFSNKLGLMPLSSVYADPILPYVIIILSANAVISGFESSKLHEANRNLSLHKITQIELVSQVAGLLIMLAWVVFDRSIWALVIGSLSSVLIKTLLSHTWLPGSPNHWHWDITAFKEIIKFGKWIFLSSILGFLVNSGDRVILGGLLDAADLGVYVIAFFIFKSILDTLSKITGDVALPSLSEVARERPGELKSAYYRFHSIIASFSYLFSGILIISGHTIIQLLYDSRYTQAGWMLEILAFSLMTIPSRLATQGFVAIGEPKLLSTIISIQLTIMCLAMPIGFALSGLEGAIWGFVLSNFSTLPTTIFWQIKYKLFNFRKELIALPSVILGLFFGMALNLIIH